MNVLIDTSAWIEALRKKGDEKVRAKVQELLVSGEARVCEPILLELFHGAQGKEEIKTIKELSSTIPLLSCNESVYSLSFDLAQKLRAKGVTVPAMDILIYATAKHYNTGLFHKDSDYTLIEKVL